MTEVSGERGATGQRHAIPTVDLRLGFLTICLPTGAGPRVASALHME